MFNKLLIANRGEIACRIARTAKRMGIATVAVYSEIDSQALHVKACDEAVCLGVAKVTDSYLNGDKILSEAIKLGVNAVHPGYGFLSENTDFAAKCENAGITFVGPSSESIHLMGSKSAARLSMQAANVPILPGYDGEEQDIEHLINQAVQIGFPLLIKAVSGGGGKGMRVVGCAEEMESALESVKRESLSAFGDDRVILEKYLDTARHIEVQVFGDSHGNVVHLFERDCSLQRRNQKVIEESPATAIDAKLRKEITDAAIACARSIHYLGAGTIEFLLAPDKKFYFMEMNTRLQVEHPVTEMITGLDLVEWQLRVANGEALPRTQEQIQIKGHAVEARIYAENPRMDFLPATGKLALLRQPVGQNIRVDTGVSEGDEISIYYDPMIAKLIVWAESRDAALNLLIDSMKSYPILGLENNIAFLIALANQPRVRQGEYATSFIENNLDTLTPDNLATLDNVLILATLAVVNTQSSANRIEDSDFSSPWDACDFWQNGLERNQNFSFEYEGHTYCVTLISNHNRLIINANNKIFSITSHSISDKILVVSTENGHMVSPVVRLDNNIYLLHNNLGYHFKYIDPRETESDQDQSENSLNAPMPGTVVALKTDTGKAVNLGDTLMIIEAMKMEHRIKAPRAGQIQSIGFKVGDQVQEGDILFELVGEAIKS